MIYKKTVKECFNNKKLISFYRIDNSNVCFNINGYLYNNNEMVLDNFQRIENYKVGMKDLIEESKKEIYAESSKTEFNNALKLLFRTEWQY